jgi:hypothetical protein
VVALEASANAWEIHDRLVSRVERVTVVHPRLLQLIAASPVKTDALTLARFLVRPANCSSTVDRLGAGASNSRGRTGKPREELRP